MTKKTTLAQVEAALIRNAGQPALAARELQISPEAVRARIARNPRLGKAVAEFNDSILSAARGVVAEAIVAKDKRMVRWLLERRDPDYASKSETRLPDDQLQAIVLAISSDPAALEHLEQVLED